MNPIIDPSVFYWMNIFSILQTVFAVFGAIALLAGIIAFICYAWQFFDPSDRPKPPEEPEKPEKEDEEEREGHSVYYERKEKYYKEAIKRYHKEYGEYLLKIKAMKSLKKWICILIVVGLIFVAASVFIPGKTTSVEMLVAKTATYDNVNWSIEQVKEIIDYIVSSLKGLS